jgi:hypothetical protein
MQGLNSQNISTRVKTSADNGSIYLHGHEKDGITVPATVSASGTKWPLCFLAAGKTSRVRNEPTRSIETSPAELQPFGLANE